MLPVHWQRSAFPRHPSFIFIIIYITSITLLVSSHLCHMWLHPQLFRKMPIINCRESIISLSSSLQRINVLLDLIITSLFPSNSCCLYPALFAFSSPSLWRFFWWSSLLLLCGTIPKVALIRTMRPLSDLKGQSELLIYALYMPYICCATALPHPRAARQAVPLPCPILGLQNGLCHCPGGAQPLLAPRCHPAQPGAEGALVQSWLFI